MGTRWKSTNEARRHLGYSVNDDIGGIAQMNGAVLALKTVVDQIKRTKAYRNLQPEMRDLKPDKARLEAMQVTAILGTTKGSAMAIWTYSPTFKRVKVDICVGDDCMDQGPYAEKQLLRYLATKGGELGATTLWCRTRRSESGRIIAPVYFEEMGLVKIPYEQQEQEDW